MVDINKTITLKLIFLISIIALSSAFFIEYVLGHQPCKLCIYERIPYFLSILLIIKMFFSKQYEKITLLLLSLIFVGSAILAFYHFGIEQGFFNETLVCKTESVSETLSKEELLEQLKKNPISCKDVSFRILGLSLAAINTIFSLVISLIFARLFLNYKKI